MANACWMWMRRSVGVLSIALIFCASRMRSQNSGGEYTFLVGAGIVCDGGDAGKCPATVKSENGDSYQMSGAGTFDTNNKSVVAAGTYTHESPDGTVMETGVWSASQLVRFDSYGIAPAAALGRNAGGDATFGAKPRAGAPLQGWQRVARLSGAMPTGGLGLFRIHLWPMMGTRKTAVLQVNCALGDVPHERSVEGIRLTFENNASEFSEEVSGRVMFLSMRPEVSAPAKVLHQEPQPESTKPPGN